MSLKEKDLNPNRKELDVVKPQTVKKHSGDYFWDKKKLRVLDLVLFGELTLIDIAKDQYVLTNPRKIAQWMNHRAFRQQYDRIINAALDRRRAKSVLFTEELLEKLIEHVRANYKSMDVNKAVMEIRKLMKQDVEPEGKIPSQLIVAKDSNLQIISPRAAKLMEEVVLKDKGFKELDISKKEKENLQHEKSTKSESKDSAGSGRDIKKVDNELDSGDRPKDREGAKP